ncbi:MAG TPA: threonine synthase [Deltaproteobacteria bacterium]|nr:threonine synthase [Deltaproteobacteria bacterium]
MAWNGLVDRYRDRLPVGDAPAVTLLEGNTPLIEAPRLASALGLGKDGLDVRVLLKYEGLNPTGSFKDRGMCVAMTVAVAQGATAVICASTGNPSAAAAAYAARAGLSAFVIVPEGNIALGKLSQAVIHGATVLAVDGNFDDAYRVVSGVAELRDVTVVNSINPDRLQGQKTAAFEICEVLDAAPDYHFLPVGNAGNITAYWMGYREYYEAGISAGLPRMMGFQAAGAAPIVEGHPVADPSTLASAIRIGNPVSWKKAEAARDESGGVIEAVTDDEILEAYSLLASSEGVFAEPASAASVAGLRKLAQEGRIDEKTTVVCTLTGHGLKDPDNAIAVCPTPLRVPADVDKALVAMGL